MIYLLLEIITDQSIYNKLPINHVSEPPNSYLLPDGQVVFNVIDTVNMNIDFTYAVNDHPSKPYHRGK